MAVDMSPKPTSPDFHFTISTTAPSSPRLFGEPFNYEFHYTSAPTSPTRAASIFSSFSTYDNNEFAFDSGRISVGNPLPEISTADELFDNGRIRPLQSPLALPERGRNRSSLSTNSENRARASRSLSPLRDHNTAEVSTLLPKCDSGRRKWRLKDLFLFRSASEGRATGRESRDPLRNYTLFPSFFSPNCSSSSSSLPSNKKAVREESNCTPVRRGGRRQVASSHEMHYTSNRAVAEGQRKKTPLAYETQGFFGFIQYNPAIRSITKGFSSNSSRP